MNPWLGDNCEHLTDVERQMVRRRLHIAPCDIAGPPTGLIIGECPPEGNGNRLPLFPHPSNSVGGMLLKYSGLTPGQYIGRLLRINLFTAWGPEWDFELAIKRADELKPMFKPGFKILLVGRRVGLAFECGTPFVGYEEKGVHYLTIPHPKHNPDMYATATVRTGVKAAFAFAANTLVQGKL